MQLTVRSIVFKEEMMKGLSERQRNQDVILMHPGKNLPEVMADIFEQYPEESFYFLNEGKLKETAHIFQENFLPEDPRRRIAYAVKANHHDEVLRILTEAGVDSFDCASVGEINAVQSVNSGAEIFYNHPHKKRREIKEASALGIRHFTADIEVEVDKILQGALNLAPEIAIRLKTLNEKGAMINLSEKFGSNETQAKELLKKIERHGAQACLSMNVGSQVLDIGSYERSFSYLIRVARESVGKVLSINLGGGIPVFLDNSLSENDEILGRYLKVFSNVLREGVAGILRTSSEAKIIIEPGRSMIASSIDLAMAIINKQESNSLFIDDGIFTSFSDTAVHDWKYKMQGINNKGAIIDGEKRNYTLNGRTCDSGDVIYNQIISGNLTERDYIHVPNAGAYLSSQSTGFNGFPVHRYVIYNS